MGPGSPPRSRGRPVLPVVHGGVGGLTRAFAGKTLALKRLLDSIGAHPRIRGEDCRTRLTSTRAAGSPPHSRGRRAGRDDVLQPLRLTPAFAGKTRERERDYLASWAHPRIRGEDLMRASLRRA